MPATTINGWALKWAVGIISTIFISLVGFIGKGVVDNDQRNTVEHIEIRKDSTEGFEKVKEIVTDIRIEQMEMRTEQKQILREIKKIPTN